jgi:hypothetical protein
MIQPAPRPIALLDHDPRRAIQDEKIVCLICGRALRQLTNTHLRSHGMGPDAYRREFGYNARRSLMCHRLRRFYAERAVRSNLAGRIRQRPIVLQPELRRRGGRRSLAWEEVLTRFEARHPGKGALPRPVTSAAAD